MTRIDEAESRMRSGFNCSQAILATFANEFGLDELTALKIAAGFGGGMGRMGETCGAVTGAFMVIGLRFGFTAPDDAETRKNTYKIVRDFTDRFTKENGSIKCRDLLTVDISTTEGYQRAVDQKLFTTICPRIVRNAAEIVEKILAPK
jgi:C_GCAxxG_C_C family probable redox protein